MILDGPVLDKIYFKSATDKDVGGYPFDVPIIKNLMESGEGIEFKKQVTFFVGENGTGKSTLLEAIAMKIGFGKEGGSRNINFLTAPDYGTNDPTYNLSRCMNLSWRKKVRDGYFFRAESFFNVANFLEDMSKGPGGADTFLSYGGKSLHVQSHGESFLAFFTNRVGRGGVYVFDEPEAALSPQRQLSLLVVINELCKDKETQFIIATHSPILLAYPGATIFSCDGKRLEVVDYKETKHYQITKEFLDNPGMYFDRLFS